MPPKIDITHNGTLDIATGRSRRETNWKNKEMAWSDLVLRLSQTHRTAETYNEYLSSKKVRQDEIKDVGGFVGGQLTGGRRKSGCVMHRQLVTLDIDFGTSAVWGDFLLFYENAAVIYSTHKHGPDLPRYRLILPLDRPVLVDEYMAIARRLAGTIGINYFDHTTYQPERLMYWPSTSKDGEFFFDYQDGPWISADKILGSYRDWTDTSEWPMGDREQAIVKKGILKQGDPLEKPGVVGAFCRAYDIHEAIATFLGDIYEECAIENRYTYKEGSTAAGLVTYDDKYAFSHHGTDPISGKLCNAFDLVRLHKFGLRDEDVKDATPGVKLPSYNAMLEFASADPKSKKLLVSELLTSATEDFADIGQDDEDPGVTDDDTDDGWKEQMDTDKRGNFLSTINNIFVMLENDPRLKGRLVYDEFQSRLIACGNLPWRKVTPFNQDFTDDDDECLAHYLERKKVPFSYVQKALAKVRITHGFHPVRSYLETLEWDGESRLDDLFIDYLGAEDSEYTRAVTRKALVAAVARIYRPGCSFDKIPVLVGKQGIGKSTLISKLGRQWFSNNFGDVHTKEAMENLRGVWIMEIGELSKLKSADVDAIKNFLSTREDIYRPAYGRKLARYPRQCIFIGSTNNFDFLRDATGNRRFFPISVGVNTVEKDVFEGFDEHEIDQVWAEAVRFFKQGETLELSEKIKEIAEAVQEAHTVDNGQGGMIQEYLDLLLPETWDKMNLSQRRAWIHYDDDDIKEKGTVARRTVCVAEIWCELFKKDKGDMNSYVTKEIHDTMRKIKGWRPTKGTRKFSNYGYQKGYELTNAGKMVREDKQTLTNENKR